MIYSELCLCFNFYFQAFICKEPIFFINPWQLPFPRKWFIIFLKFRSQPEPTKPFVFGSAFYLIQTKRSWWLKVSTLAAGYSEQASGNPVEVFAVYQIELLKATDGGLQLVFVKSLETHKWTNNLTLQMIFWLTNKWFGFINIQHKKLKHL